MVKYRSGLGDTFDALSHPTRRAIIKHLKRVDACTVSDLARHLFMKLPALTKHLNILSNAGLIRRVKESRTVTVRLSVMPIREAMNWLHHYDPHWAPRSRLLAQ